MSSVYTVTNTTHFMLQLYSPFDHPCANSLQAYSAFMTSMTALVITFIVLAAHTAEHCVYMNGVCIDRPFAGQA